MRNPRAARRAPLTDRLFIAACTLTYLVLAGVVVAALNGWGV